MAEVAKLEELREAVVNGATSRTLRSLLSRCPPNTVNQALDEAGTTLLHLASNLHDPDIVQVLLDFGGDVRAQTTEGYTPLHAAAVCGHLELVRKLLEGGADPQVYDEEDLLPLELAMEAGHTNCAELLQLWPDPAPTPHKQTMAETFVSMYSDVTLSVDDSFRCNDTSLEELFTTALDINRDATPPPPTSLTPPTSPPTHADKEEVKVSASILQLTNDQLRERLKKLGEAPGPITCHTRRLYQLYLMKLESGLRPQKVKESPGYKYELSLVLGGLTPIPDFRLLETQVFQSLRTASGQKSTKCHFNYLLMDPRCLHDVCGDDLKAFRCFVQSVFYVGKGKNSRSLQHLKDAKDHWTTRPRTKCSEKLRRILEIWSDGFGVLSLHVFPHTTAQEAFTREAAMIDAIGLPLLTNVVLGSYHGDIRSWPAGRRRQLGVYLLHRALKVYLVDPPPPITHNDI